MNIINKIISSYLNNKSLYIGEKVTIAEHMIQTAMLAEKNNCSSNLICSSLLHDYGHFILENPDDLVKKEKNGRHEYLGYEFLKKYFVSANSQFWQNGYALSQYETLHAFVAKKTWLHPLIISCVLLASLFALFFLRRVRRGGLLQKFLAEGMYFNALYRNILIKPLTYVSQSLSQYENRAIVGEYNQDRWHGLSIDYTF